MGEGLRVPQRGKKKNHTTVGMHLRMIGDKLTLVHKRTSAAMLCF